MLEHGIDRLPARTKIVGNPPRQRPAIRLRHTAEPEMPQNHRAMPAGGAPGKIIVVHGFGIETKLLRQIQDRSEEHTSELHSLMRNSYAVIYLKKKHKKKTNQIHYE